MGSLPDLHPEKNNPREDKTFRARTVLFESSVLGAFKANEATGSPVRLRSRALYLFDLELLCVDSVIFKCEGLKELGERAHVRTVRTCSFADAPRESIAQVDTQKTILAKRVQELHGDLFVPRAVAT